MGTLPINEKKIKKEIILKAYKSLGVGNFRKPINNLSNLDLQNFGIKALCDLWMRPLPGGRNKKCPGFLEVHENEFRYISSQTNDFIKVMFTDIKHAFFQTAEFEIITLIHFHLYTPILINKKKTYDLQFYVEIMEAFQTIEGNSCISFENNEKKEDKDQRKHIVHHEFVRFTKRIKEKVWDKYSLKNIEGKALEWDIPYRKLGFDGAPHKSMSKLFPTNNCLVNLIEIPFTVVTLDEIEVVNLERAALHLKNFDMAIVNKDFSKEILLIEAIPMINIDRI